MSNQETFYVIKSSILGYIKSYKSLGIDVSTNAGGGFYEGKIYDINYTDDQSKAKRYKRRGMAYSTINRIYDYYQRDYHSCVVEEVKVKDVG